jgi:hypothetical protein
MSIPRWSDTSGRASSDRRGGERRPGSPGRPAREPSPRSGASRREPLPQLGDAFKRTTLRDDDIDDRSPDSTRDPYDRLRRVPARPQKPVDFGNEHDTEQGYFGDDDERYAPYPPVPRDEPNRGRRRVSTTPERRSTVSTIRQHRGEQLGGLVAGVSPHVRDLAGIVGVNLASLFLMVLLVAFRLGSLAPWIPIHLNAEGTPDLWGSRTTLWRIPLMAGMITVMAAALGWFMAKRDPFASRFVLLAAMLVQTLCWIGLLHLLW